MKAARWAGRFARRTGFAPGIGLAVNFGNRPRGCGLKWPDWMVVSEVNDQRVRYEKKHEPGHQPCPAARRTWEFVPHAQTWESPVQSCYLSDGTTGRCELSMDVVSFLILCRSDQEVDIARIPGISVKKPQRGHPQ